MWQSPDGQTRNQIDHIKRWKNSLLDVRTYRGADHQLLVGTVKLKPANKKKINKLHRKYYDICKLKNTEIVALYDKKLIENYNGYEVCDSTTTDEKWEKIQKVSTAEEILGKTKTTRKPWISNATWSLIEERRLIKEKINQSNQQEDILAYNVVNKKIKKSARKDKRDFTNNIVQQAETAAKNRDTRNIYRAVKNLRGNNHNIPQIKGKDGNILTSDEQQRSRWREYFQENFSDPIDQESEEEEEEEEEEEANTATNDEPPVCTEVIQAIQQLKNNKAAGSDGIPLELLKASPSTMANIILPLIHEIWNTKNIPRKWKEGLIITIPKKGNLSECGNWRGITLLNSITKILSLIIMNRIAPALNNQIRNEQAGFRPSRSCIDQINTIRIITEQSAEWNSPLFLAFVDFERAFDSLNRSKIWLTLRQKNVSPHLIEIIKEIYRDAECKVIFKGHTSDSFITHTGVKQGCVLSPLLFTIVLDQALTEMNAQCNGGIQWNLTRKLNDLDYADDICLISHSGNDMENKLRVLSTTARKLGLIINTNKTKIMRFNTCAAEHERVIKMEDQVIQEVQEFTYLGAIIAKDGGTSKDIDNRISKARKHYGMLHKIWRSSHMSRITKIRIFNACVKSVLLYGCETWKITKEINDKLQVFLNKCMRRIMGIFWPEKITNTELWRITHQKPVEIEIKRRKWRWIGHILRRDQGDINRMALDWNPPFGKRKRGRPKITWKRTIESEIKKVDKSWSEIKEIAKDRTKYKELEDTLCST